MENLPNIWVLFGSNDFSEDPLFYYFDEYEARSALEELKDHEGESEYKYYWMTLVRPGK